MIILPVFMYMSSFLGAVIEDKPHLQNEGTLAQEEDTLVVTNHALLTL